MGPGALKTNGNHHKAQAPHNLYFLPLHILSHIQEKTMAGVLKRNSNHQKAQLLQNLDVSLSLGRVQKCSLCLCVSTKS